MLLTILSPVYVFCFIWVFLSCLSFLGGWKHRGYLGISFSQRVSKILLPICCFFSVPEFMLFSTVKGRWHDFLHRFVNFYFSLPKLR